MFLAVLYKTDVLRINVLQSVYDRACVDIPETSDIQIIYRIKAEKGECREEIQKKSPNIRYLHVFLSLGWTCFGQTRTDSTAIRKVRITRTEQNRASRNSCDAPPVSLVGRGDAVNWLLLWEGNAWPSLCACFAKHSHV